MSVEPQPEPSPPTRSRWRRPLWIGLALAVLLAGGALLVRFGVLAPQARLVIEAQGNGLKVGRLGVLHMEGLQGDVWDAFTIRRLSLSDDEGVWLEAKDVLVDWNYVALLQRRFRAELITADHVRVLRRPTLEPSSESAGLPVSIEIDAFRARLELMPAFSQRHGLYDLAGGLQMRRRNQGQKGQIAATSVTRPGDQLKVVFDFGGSRLLLDAKGREARGGALAGALGLAPDQPFILDIDARGSDSQGRFVATARSGADNPLQAEGRWSPAGGSAQGRLSLAASTLTRDYADALGPELSFSINGRRVAKGLYDLAARVEADHLRIAATGQGNIGEQRTGPGGIAVSLTSDALPALVETPRLGRVAYTGRLNGDAKAWRLTGQAVLNNVAVEGYALDQVAGPLGVTANKGQLRLETSLTGSGGQGDGVPAALLGRAPSLQAAVVRQSDGRLNVERLNARGAGLRLQARGGRGFLGRLTFQGEMELSNLAAARAGASGRLTADWRAAQAGADRPWTLGFEARGRELATGFAELDRLLGAAPRLRFSGRLQDGELAIETARLEGRAVGVRARGAVGGPRGYRLDLDWDARGPFAAGPVEISGQARGTGAIRGALDRPRADLNARFAQVHIPSLPLRDVALQLSFMREADGGSGAISVQAASEYGPAAGRADFAFPRGGVDLSKVQITAGGVEASGSVALRQGSPSRADLQVAVGPGAFLTSGRVAGTLRIVDAAGGPAAALDLQATGAQVRGADLTITSGRLTANGPLSRLPYALDAAGQSQVGTWRLDAQGVLAEAGAGRQLTLAGSGALAGQAFRTLQPAQVRFGDGPTSASLRLATAGEGQISADLRLGDRAQVTARLTNLALQLANEDLQGSVSGQVNLQGSGNTLTGAADLTLTDARGRGSPRDQGLDGRVQATLAGDDLTVQAALSNPQGLRASGRVVLPAQASASPLRLAIHRQRAMRGEFSARGQIQPLWDLLVGGERSLAGEVDVTGRLSGSLSDPKAVGRASISRGAFEDYATGLKLQALSAQATFEGPAINLTALNANDGEGGAVAGSGRISLYRNGASNLQVVLTRFQVIDNDMATAKASGTVTLNRTGEGALRVGGGIRIDEAEISAQGVGGPNVPTMDVIEINRPPGLTRFEAKPASTALAAALDISIRAPRQIFVRGRGLDLELALSAQVGGTTANPVLSGTASVVRGDYTFAGKRFVFDRSGTVRLATSPERIRLNLTATREDPSLTATVRVQGTAASPQISLTSNPSLPSDEILSQVLFGQSASQLSALEAAQLATAIASLQGGGGFDLLGQLRSFAGLDRLTFGGNGSGFAVAAGKYVADDIYLEIIGGGRDGPGARVEWRVRRNLSLVSELLSQGGAKLSVRWRREMGRQSPAVRAPSPK